MEERSNVGLQVSEAALDDHAAQLWQLRRCQCGRDGAKRVAQNTEAVHVYVAPRAQPLDHRRDIQPLTDTVRDHVAFAFTMPREVEHHGAVAVSLVQARDLWNPLAAIVVDAMTADEDAAVARWHIPGGEHAARAGYPRLFGFEASIGGAYHKRLPDRTQQQPCPPDTKRLEGDETEQQEEKQHDGWRLPHIYCSPLIAGRSFSGGLT